MVTPAELLGPCVQVGRRRSVSLQPSINLRLMAVDPESGTLVRITGQGPWSERLVRDPGQGPWSDILVRHPGQKNCSGKLFWETDQG